MAPSPPWMDLPQELLSTISTFLLSNPLDILRFRSVCKSWHLSLPSLHSLSPPLPLKTPPPPSPLRHRHTSPNEFYSLSCSTIFALRPPVDPRSNPTTPRTWLLFLDQLNPETFTVRKPFTKRDFDLPLDFPRHLNLLDFHASELGHFHNLTYGYTRLGKVVKNSVWSNGFNKVVFLRNGSGFVVLDEDGRLGLLKLGEGELEWEVVHDGKGFRFDDIVDYKGRVLAIDRRARVFEMGCHSSKMSLLGASIARGGGRRKRLVESLGVLYLVVRCNDRGTNKEVGKYKVYVLNEEKMKWVEVASVEGRVFFFGDEFALSASAEEFKGSFGENCIVFSERSFGKYEKGYGDSYLFSRLRRNALRVGVYHLEVVDRLHPVDSYPSYSETLWPPPTWLWKNAKSKLLGTFEAAIDRLLMQIRDDNLKAKFKEVSPLVRYFVSGGCQISRQEVLNGMKQTDMLHEFLNKMVEEIQKESKVIRMNIAGNSMPRWLDCQSTGLPNQGGPKDGDGSADAEDEWLSKEVTRRLDTHSELKVNLNSISHVFKESIDKFQDVIKFNEQHSATAADAETSLSQSTQSPT